MIALTKGFRPHELARRLRGHRPWPRACLSTLFDLRRQSHRDHSVLCQAGRGSSTTKPRRLHPQGTCGRLLGAAGPRRRPQKRGSTTQLVLFLTMMRAALTATTYRGSRQDAGGGLLSTRFHGTTPERATALFNLQHPCGRIRRTALPDAPSLAMPARHGGDLWACSQRGSPSLQIQFGRISIVRPWRIGSRPTPEAGGQFRGPEPDQRSSCPADYPLPISGPAPAGSTPLVLYSVRVGYGIHASRDQQRAAVRPDVRAGRAASQCSTLLHRRMCWRHQPTSSPREEARLPTAADDASVFLPDPS